jgi:hypothetical protein
VVEEVLEHLIIFQVHHFHMLVVEVVVQFQLLIFHYQVEQVLLVEQEVLEAHLQDVQHQAQEVLLELPIEVVAEVEVLTLAEDTLEVMELVLMVDRELLF